MMPVEVPGMMDEEIAFLGLGLLGSPMAANLLESGYRVAVYNRTAAKAGPLVARGARPAALAVDAVRPGGVVVSVLWDAEAVESVVRADGFLERLGEGGIHIAMCTGLPETARRLAVLHADAGAAYVEAPAFGRPEAAVARRLWVAFAGPKAAKERARPVLTALGAQGIFDFGEEAGAATIVKLAGNFLSMSAVRSLVEALGMVEKAGVDPREVLQMLTATLFPSPVYEGYGRLIVEKNTESIRSPIPGKDLDLFRTVGAEVGAATPVAERLLEIWEKRR